MDRAGNLFIGDNANHRVRKVSPAGIISSIAGSGSAGYSGDDGPAAGAQRNWPTGLAVDASGDLYIADYSVVSDDEGDYVYDGRVLRMTASGAIDTITPEGSGQGLLSPRGITVDPAGDVYVADAAAGKVIKISPGGVITTAAGDVNGETDCPAIYFNLNSTQLVCPAGVALDSSGNLYVTDTGHGRIAKLSPKGEIANVVGDETPGNYWGDGGKASDAALDVPLGVAVDTAGNLYIADTRNSRVRRVSHDGVIITVAGNGTSGYSTAVTSAQLGSPAGLAVDAAGNLYISGGYLSGNPAGAAHVRIVTPAGMINNIAGNGTTGYSGDGGPAPSASFSAATAGIVVDAGGTVYVADIYNNVIRALRPPPQ